MKIIVSILSIALVGLGGGAIHLWRELESSHQQIADLQARLDAATAAAEALAVKLPPPVASAAIPDQPGTTEPPATRDAPASTPAPAPAIDESVAALREMIASPENRARTSKLMRAMLPTQYPDVGKVLGLSPEQVEQLFDLLARQQDEQSNLFRDRPEDPAAMQATAQKALAQRQASEAELASMLGSKYPQWQQYQQELPTRRQVSDLGTALNAGGMPLSDAQSKPLIAALVVEQKRISQEAAATAQRGTGISAAMSRYTPENNQRMLDAASAYLTPQQLQAYQQMLERQGNMERSLRGTLEQAQAAQQASPAEAPGR